MLGAWWVISGTHCYRTRNMVRCVVKWLEAGGTDLALDVLEARRRHDAEANQEDVGLGVRKGPQTIVIFLTGSIPEAKVDHFAVHHHIGRV